MIKIRENKGVTLIAIIVTIIILIILAGISISAITGNNSLIKQAGKAKYESGVANEREMLELEIARIMDESPDGSVTEGDLSKALEGMAKTDPQGRFINITFNDSGKKYRIDPYGNIKENNRKKFDNPTSVYAKLYTDNIVILSSFDYTDPNRQVKTDYSNKGGWQSSGCTKIIIYDEIAPGSGNRLFLDCNQLEKIENIENLHTEFITNMYKMFNNCGSLVDLDLSYFDTSKVTTMQDMFWNCTNLKSVDLSSFETDKVTNMGFMFRTCSKLGKVNLKSFNTESLTHMGSMFEGCKTLEEIDLSSFETNKVTNMSSVFSGCNSVTKINLGNNFNTSQVTSMSGMFNDCHYLREIDVSHFDTRKVTNMANMFYGCGQKIDGEFKLDLKNFDTSNVTSMKGMFQNCATIKTLDLSSFNTEKVTTMNRMFMSCSSLETLDLSNFSFSLVTDMFQFFAWDGQLKNLNFKNAVFTGVAGYSSMFQGTPNTPFSVTVSSNEETASLQKGFITERRQSDGRAVPTYVTE